MSTFTENYSLVKPDTEDYYDVAYFNENMDAIDTLMAETETAVGEISEKIGSPDDSGETTIFGKLNSGGSLIKSMQTVDLSMQANNTATSASIQTVDPMRCLVIMTHLNVLSGLTLEYTLSESSISASAKHNTTTNTARMRFQIIEFY